jgi:hypothetical protein
MDIQYDDGFLICTSDNHYVGERMTKEGAIKLMKETAARLEAMP